jgi:hypothetical protein
MMTHDELVAYYKSLSEAQIDEAEAIEGAIGKQLQEGFTEDEAGTFVQTVMAVREAARPELSTPALVACVFNIALLAGLRHVQGMLKSQSTKPKAKPGKSGGKLSGKGI